MANTVNEIKFDINFESLDTMEEAIEEGNMIFPMKEKIVLEGKIKYHKSFIRLLKMIQNLERNKKIKRILEKNDKAVIIIKSATKKRKVKRRTLKFRYTVVKLQQ